MANLAISALQALSRFLTAPDGVNHEAHKIAVRDMVRIPEIRPEQVVIRHATPTLAEAAGPVSYPSVYLFCDRIENLLDSKFREFSGRLFLVAEVRVSDRGVRELDLHAARLAEATTNVLTNHRGRWTDYCSFDGRFDIRFNPLEEGGLRYSQTARIEIELIATA